MRVYEAVAETLRDARVEVMFGLLGSGNFRLANAVVARGIAFYSARHETGAVAMAESYARLSGGPAVCTFHQGPGVTNAVTGLAEAAKSRTAIVAVLADTASSEIWSEFRIDQRALMSAIGVVEVPIRDQHSIREWIDDALRRAMVERRPVAVMLPTDLQQRACRLGPASPAPAMSPPDASAAAIRRMADTIEACERPVILVGRGAVSGDSRGRLERLGQTIGAVMGTTALAKGFFGGGAYDVGVLGGYSTAVAMKLAQQADLFLVFGASLNHRTTHDGAVIAGDAKVLQVDVDPTAFGAQHRVDVEVVGDAEATAATLADELERRRFSNHGFRTAAVASEIADGTWHALPFAQPGDPRRIDPRRLSIALNDLLPAERTLVLDSGVFQTYPFAYIDVPDPAGLVFVHSFMSVGFGLGNAVGAAVARPDRLTVAAVGDGGALMALSELETIVRYRLRILVVVYNDAAYGAEVERCRQFGESPDLVTFPQTDFAALAQALGYRSVTVRSETDLEAVREWARDPDGPFLIDAKINPDVWAGWFGERFEESWKREAQA